MTGQADTAPETVDDLAQFLVDNPEADSEGSAQPGKETAQADNSDADEELDDESGDASPDDEDADSDEDEGDADPAKSQTSGLKFKVPVKGEDGADTSIEVDEKELIAGYQRHADYTRKTMELGEREREAHALVERKLTEGRDHYMQQAALAHAAVRTLAGLRSDAEMAELASSNPSLWVAERQRAEAINGVLSQLEQGMQHEKQQAEAQTREQQVQAFHKAWGVLGSEGIDKPKLASIFDGIAKHYGVEKTRFANVSDPKVVLIMRDAMAFRELKDKAATVQKKVLNAPKLPAPRQSVPPTERVNKRLNERFKSGRAKVNDLADFLQANNF